MVKKEERRKAIYNKVRALTGVEHTATLVVCQPRRRPRTPLLVALRWHTEAFGVGIRYRLRERPHTRKSSRFWDPQESIWIRNYR